MSEPSKPESIQMPLPTMAVSGDPQGSGVVTLGGLWISGSTSSLFVSGDGPLPFTPIMSGSSNYPDPICPKCGKEVGVSEGRVWVAEGGIINSGATYHIECTSYIVEKGFDTRANWIRESTQEQWPWTSGIFNDQLADLLLDHGRTMDAEVIRGSSR